MLLNVNTYPQANQTVKFTAQELLEGNSPYYAYGFHGMTVADSSSGDEYVLDIAARVWQVNVGSLTAALGTKIYIDPTTGDLTNTSTNNHLFGIVCVAKDSNNIADLYLVPQHA